MVAITTAPTLASAPGPSPEAIALQQAYAKQLLQGSGQPIHSWTEGVAGIVDAIVGGTMARKAGERQSAAEAGAAGQSSDLIMALMNPAGAGQTPGASSPSASSPPPDTGDMFGQGLAEALPAAGGAAPAASSPTAGAPAIDPAQVRAVLANPWIPEETKQKILALWQASMPKPPAPPEYKFMDAGNGHIVRTRADTGQAEEAYAAPEKPGDNWVPLDEPDPQGRTILVNTRNGDRKVAVDSDVMSAGRFGQAKTLAELGKPSVVVDNRGRELPDPEKGYVWKFGHDGKVETNADGAAIQVPIGGGSVEAARAAEAGMAADTQKQANIYADVVTTDIDRTLDAITKSPGQTTGVGGSLLSWIPGSHAYDTSELLKTIRANVGFDRLQEMRKNSPTGGALGPVSDFENQLLQATIGSLSQYQSPEQLRTNLARVKKIYSAIMTTGIKPGDPIATETGGGTPSREDVEAELKRRGLMK